MAFHPYPQLVRALFNVNRFGPPAPVTAPSAWPGVDRKVSRPPPATLGPLRTRFRSGCGPQGPCPRRRRATRRLIMQKARRHPIRGSDRLRAHGFRFSFTPLSAVLFTFPSRYLCAIGLPGVLSLGGWCRLLRTGLLLGWRGLRVRGCHPLWRAFPGAFRYPRFFLVAGPTTPRAPRRPRFGLAPFRSPLLGGSLLFSFPPTTGMFRFVGFASMLDGCRASARRVAPFGHPRI